MDNVTAETIATAHRGDSSRFRENTIAAIKSAIDCGAHIVEIDVRQSKDGEVIVLHDRSLERLWGCPVDAAGLSLSEIQELGYADYRIPTLEQVLNFFLNTSTVILIDMETIEHAIPALSVVEKTSLP